MRTVQFITYILHGAQIELHHISQKWFILQNICALKNYRAHYVLNFVFNVFYDTYGERLTK
jgi:hypothetical protein